MLTTHQPDFGEGSPSSLTTLMSDAAEGGSPFKTSTGEQWLAVAGKSDTDFSEMARREG